MSLKGITVTLTVRTQTGVDPLNVPVYEESTEDVENVLVAPASSEDIQDALNRYRKRAVYTLAIPKGDSHVWEDTEVQFFGQTFRTIGIPTGGIEAMIPLGWNKKVQVEHIGT